MRVTALARAALASAGCISLAACAVGPNFHAPPAPAVDHYTPGTQPSATVGSPGAGGAAQTLELGEDVPASWWELFQSPALDRLIQQALHDSPNLAAAEATLRAARENYLAERSALLPTVDAQAQATRERVPGAAFGLPSFPSSIFTLYDAAVNVSYRVDLFGAARRQLEAERAQWDYESWELEAARLSLIGNVVTTAIDAASLQSQITALTEALSTQRSQLDVVQRQQHVGAASQADVLTQRGQVAQTEASLPGLEKSLAQAQHRLAVLLGQPPAAGAPALTLEDLHLPAELPLSVPARLVRQRPDIRASEAQLHQASAQLGVATANLYPQLNLTGLIGTESLAANELFKPGTAAWNIGGSLTQPLFHGGQLLAQRRAAAANLDEAAAQYRETVLSALQEVADTLRALESDARALRSQAAAEQSAAGSLGIVGKQYQLGAVSYVTLLIAQRQYAQAHQARVQALAARFADSATLLQALGGGWWNR